MRIEIVLVQGSIQDAFLTSESQKKEEKEEMFVWLVPPVAGAWMWLVMCGGS